MYYAFYDKNGDILSYGYSDNPLPNTACSIDPISPETHFVSNGKIEVYTEEQSKKKTFRPSPLHKWSNETFDWVDTRTKKQKKEDIDRIISSYQGTIDTMVVAILNARKSPFQSVYDIKELQAKNWIDSEFKLPMPSFIDLESDATGVDAKKLAKTIVQRAKDARIEYDAFLPKIESIRRKWKVAISNAKDEESLKEVFLAAAEELKQY